MKKFFLLYIFSLLLFNCTDKDAEYFDPRGTDYAGSQSCIQCHKPTHEAELTHAHYNATAPGTPENVLGNFSEGHNAFVYDGGTKIAMERRGDSICHVLYENGKEQKVFPVGIVFGSRHAQTSVYWENRNTYELPVSYYTSVQNWGTSPGFSSVRPQLDRKVVKDCYACHSSNASSSVRRGPSEKTNFMTGDIEDVIDPKTIVFGIDCERCHGPAKKHVTHHLKFPGEKQPFAITKYSALTNRQKLDACAICHSGVSGVKIKSIFSFRFGDAFADYWLKPQSDNPEVHGNQYGLLSQSKCFTASNNLNCTTCHDPHDGKKQGPDYFTPVCVGCHTSPSHNSETTKIMSLKRLAGNCVECHMPKQASRAIIFQQYKNSEFSKYLLRTHKIAVYPNP
ncbi:hypothetical protein HYN48_06435 [Flavobacterium magnum]|uniref:Cytochrome c-552/4 domain-containing protein n=1 Tax=Flavobacterium magnum TaxID=2162713 RepID=A0A2S0RGA2_9FLAO|nr:multiheme c-type cytochrome [Flavobacterium magnum]AWA29742.1 hypothetical protein HYN48_06435 [Flavobacterium magnum]